MGPKSGLKDLIKILSNWSKYVFFYSGYDPVPFPARFLLITFHLGTNVAKNMLIVVSYAVQNFTNSKMKHWNNIVWVKDFHSWTVSSEFSGYVWLFPFLLYEHLPLYSGCNSCVTHVYHHHHYNILMFRFYAILRPYTHRYTHIETHSRKII